MHTHTLTHVQVSPPIATVVTGGITTVAVDGLYSMYRVFVHHRFQHMYVASSQCGDKQQSRVHQKEPAFVAV